MLDDFALLTGRSPLFEKPLPVGQLYMPERLRFESAMRDIFERRYFTNHGPLAQDFEKKLAEALGVRHAICVTNATIGLVMAADALELSGKVIVPSHTFIATAQSLKWCGLEPVFCDVDPVTHQISATEIEALVDDETSAVLGVHLWGGACDITALERVCQQHELKLFFDSAHAFGCRVGDSHIGGFGELEVFSFHATKVLSATEGGCITTNSDETAAKLRNIRSSYGAGTPVPVVKTSNGRMSELQAAIGLMSLEDFDKNQASNKKLFEVYTDRLKDIDGIELYVPKNVTKSNYQYAACDVEADEFGMSRDTLLQVLQAENVLARRYFYPGTHRCLGFDIDADEVAKRLPVTERLCLTGLQLPLGARVSVDAAHKICDVIEFAKSSAQKLNDAVESRN